ncbi:DUF3261 domain-containing protein [Photobacterium sagamiensis]|uniref:DUF3261 domain-containing protein n=1 Tax=Photobacterium sagamiensis TaxID=2910241 RepID=UPI003D098701
MPVQLTKACALGVLLTVVSGCASKPEPQANQVNIAPDTYVTLPAPAALGQTLAASQLITAQWAEQSHQLPVQLQVDQQKIALAGFSSWGSRILSLTYENQTIEASVLPGLGETLPQPEQVLFNLMLTLWPVDAWHSPLQSIGWQLIEMSQHRQLIDDKGNVVADVEYKATPHLAGDIVFTHYQLGYTITIKTLNYGPLK